MLNLVALNLIFFKFYQWDSFFSLQVSDFVPPGTTMCAKGGARPPFWEPLGLVSYANQCETHTCSYQLIYLYPVLDLYKRKMTNRDESRFI